MNPYATTRATRVAATLGVGALLIGFAYHLGERRMESQMTAQLASMPTPMVRPFGHEPVEVEGIEGFVGPQGFLVTSLDGRARRSGLQVGDTVVSSAGQPLLDPFQIVPGARMDVIRGGRTISVTIERGGWRPATNEARTIDVRGLDGQVTADGLWVNSVEGNARRWGLRRGDLVRAINGHPLHVRRDAVILIRSIEPTTNITFEIVRDGARVFLPYDPVGSTVSPTTDGVTPSRRFVGPRVEPWGVPRLPSPNDPATVLRGR